MPIEQRFTLVTLGVADVTAATEFYRRLGWRQSTHSVDDTTFFTTPGPIIALWSSAELAVDAGVATVTDAAPPAPPFRGVALAINFDSRDEVDRALADWRAAGGRITKPAEETEWGGYKGYGADLDGNLWEFAHNPFWPLDERGMPQLDGGDVQ